MAFQVTWVLIAVISIFIGEVIPVDSLNRNPGIVTRINQAGLDVIQEIAIERLKEDIEAEPISDISGTVNTFFFGIDYVLSNIRIAEFEVETSSLKLVPGVGLELNISGISVLLYDVRWSYVAGFFSDNGFFDITITGLELAITLRIRINEDGHTTIAPEGCSGDVGSIAIDSNSWLYDLISGSLEGALTDTLNDQLCSAITQEINRRGADLKLRSQVGPYTEIDYSLVSNPMFGSLDMETAHKGEFYPIGQYDEEAPYPVPAIDTTGASSKMVYMWITDYVINTAGYVFHTMGKLTYDISNDMIPSTSPLQLNTTQIGFLIPKLKKLYPNMLMELVVKSTSPPTVNFAEAGVTGTLWADVDAYVVEPDATRTYVFTIAVIAHVEGSVGFSYPNITGEVTSMSVEMELKQSDIKTFSLMLIERVANSFIESTVIPDLNELGEQGFPIPEMDGLTYINPVVSLGKDYIRLETNLEYTPIL